MQTYHHQIANLIVIVIEIETAAIRIRSGVVLQGVDGAALGGAGRARRAVAAAASEAVVVMNTARRVPKSSMPHIPILSWLKPF